MHSVNCSQQCVSASVRHQLQLQCPPSSQCLSCASKQTSAGARELRHVRASTQSTVEPPKGQRAQSLCQHLPCACLCPGSLVRKRSAPVLSKHSAAPDAVWTVGAFGWLTGAPTRSRGRERALENCQHTQTIARAQLSTRCEHLPAHLLPLQLHLCVWLTSACVAQLALQCYRGYGRCAAGYFPCLYVGLSSCWFTYPALRSCSTCSRTPPLWQP